MWNMIKEWWNGTLNQPFVMGYLELNNVDTMTAGEKKIVVEWLREQVKNVQGGELAEEYTARLHWPSE